MSYALVANTAIGSTGGGNVTTGAIDTTGANMLVVFTASLFNDATTISDSKTNTWSSLTPQNLIGSVRGQIRYCFGGTVGPGHTFTVSAGVTFFPSIGVLAFSGAVSSPFDGENGATAAAGAGPLATGSVTPTDTNDVAVSLLAYATQTGIAIDSGFTLKDAVALSGGNHYGLATAYKIKSTNAAENPQWSWTGSDVSAAAIAMFKGTAPVSSTSRLALLGVH